MGFKVFDKGDVEGIRAFRAERDMNEENHKYKQAENLMNIMFDEVFQEETNEEATTRDSSSEENQGAAKEDGSDADRRESLQDESTRSSAAGDEGSEPGRSE